MRSVLFYGALVCASIVLRRGCKDDVHPVRRDGGVPVRNGGARVPINLLCADVPAWTRDFNVGMSPNADTTLWPDTHGHFSDWVFQPGFLGAPSLELTAGGGYEPVEVSGLGVHDADTGAACAASYVARRPDIQVVVPLPGLFMRLYAVASNGSSPTLAVRTPDGHWRCNDDHGRGDWGNPTAAVLDFCLARPGRYTVWVGSADGTHHNPTMLYLSGNPEHHP
jgi:hypothetical protein